MEETWIQKHESFVISMLASGSAILGIVLAYCIKSRCTRIKFCGVEIERTPIPVTGGSTE